MERQSDMESKEAEFIPWFVFPADYNNQSWARLKLGAKNYTHVFHMGDGARVLAPAYAASRVH